jgi:nucleoside 2-deoxyribosyltransferase
MTYAKIYLAGPMAGISKESADSWRDYVAGRLDGIHEMPSGPSVEVLCFNPTRGEDTDASATFSAVATNSSPFNTVQGIIGRDRNDVFTSDLVFMCLLGAKRVSIGTTVELGWADAWRKPLILVMERAGNIHEHLFFQGLCTYRVPTLDEGIACAKYLLMPRLPQKRLLKAGDIDQHGRVVLTDQDANGRYEVQRRDF